MHPPQTRTSFDQHACLIHAVSHLQPKRFHLTEAKLRQRFCKTPLFLKECSLLVVKLMKNVPGFPGWIRYEFARPRLTLTELHITPHFRAVHVDGSLLR